MSQPFTQMVRPSMRTADHGLRTTGYGLWTAGYRFCTSSQINVLCVSFSSSDPITNVRVATTMG